MALDFAIGQSFHRASDHFPLLLAGVPTGGIESVRKAHSGRGYGHTWYDTVDKVEQTNLREAASLAARIALRIAFEDDWPAFPRDKESVSKLLNMPDQKEITALNERLDAFFAKA